MARLASIFATADAGSTPEPASVTATTSFPLSDTDRVSSLAEGGVVSFVQKWNVNAPASPGATVSKTTSYEPGVGPITPDTSCGR